MTVPLHEHVLLPEFIAGMEHLPLTDLRSLRSQCERVEAGVSFARRILHGRIDIIEHERSRRRDGAGSTTLSELLANVPAILSESRLMAPGRGARLVMTPEVDCVHDELMERVDAIAGPQELAEIADLGDFEIERLSESLSELERNLSMIRRQVFARIDLLQVEISERYKRGDATLEGLIR